MSRACRGAACLRPRMQPAQREGSLQSQERKYGTSWVASIDRFVAVIVVTVPRNQIKNRWRAERTALCFWIALHQLRKIVECS